jgi:hypothetical protein
MDAQRVATAARRVGRLNACRITRDHGARRLSWQLAEDAGFEPARVLTPNTISNSGSGCSHGSVPGIRRGQGEACNMGESPTGPELRRKLRRATCEVDRARGGGVRCRCAVSIL